MSNKRLGKGISELLSEKNNHNNTTVNTPILVPINLLHPNKFQPRKIFTEEALKELSISITSNGVIQPILVRKIPEKSGYEIIAGERRWRASIIAKLKEIPIIIKDLDDKKCLELSIVENIQRQDLTAIEEADSYKNLIDAFSYTHEELSSITGKSRSHITNILRILSLPKEIKSLINKRDLSFGHARALVNVSNAESIAKMIILKGLSVRETEALIKSLSNKKNIKSSVNKFIKDDILKLEQTLNDHYGLNVNISEKKGKGSIKIQFNSINQLNDIIRKLRIQ